MALVYAFFNLGINADNLSLISDSLQSRKNQAAFAALFPNLEEAILIVIDGDTPAHARDATNALATRLKRDPEAFKDVYVPGGGSFFEDHALHFYFLGGPDFVVGPDAPPPQRNILGVIETVGLELGKKFALGINVFEDRLYDDVGFADSLTLNIGLQTAKGTIDFIWVPEFFPE